jgi:hypothetical protein
MRTLIPLGDRQMGIARPAVRAARGLAQRGRFSDEAVWLIGK